MSRMVEAVTDCAVTVGLLGGDDGSVGGTTLIVQEM